MGAPWDGFIPEETIEHYRRAGFARASRPGTRPALLIIDTQYLTAGEGPMPLSEAIAYHPMNCGTYAWEAIGQMVPLLAAFRKAGAPVIHAYTIEDPLRGAQWRMPTRKIDPRLREIVKEVAPIDGDILLPKTCPSAFFGTPLVKYLNTLKVDTLFLVGNTTSGCIRASVIDGMSYDYKVIVPHDACYDRSPVSHAVNLFDMASKYAEVVSTPEAIALLESMATNNSSAAPPRR
jgi:nicotinamidase-related amidase